MTNPAPKQSNAVMWIVLACIAMLSGTFFFISNNRPVKPTRTKAAASRKLTKATLINVVDGDTINVLIDGIETRVRYKGIDAPELDQANGLFAKEFLERLLDGKELLLDESGKDKYGCTIAFVFAFRRSANINNTNARLVELGWAWHYAEYSDTPYLDGYEEYVRKNKLGLWADDNPMPPWEWRDLMREVSTRAGKVGTSEIVGSVNSINYHHINCVHVKTIKANNLVHYTVPLRQNQSARKRAQIVKVYLTISATIKGD